MSHDLDHLLRQAARADGTRRIEFRDQIAAHGADAIAQLETWIPDPRLGGFAVATIKAAGLLSAPIEARTALTRARPRASEAVTGDIDRALASLPGAARGPAGTERPKPTGTPAEALEVLRGLARDWHLGGSRPQRPIRWRRAEWAAEFPTHRDGLMRLPASLDRTDVRTAAAGADQDPLRAEFAFLVVKAWGEGENGYGPSRARESFALTTAPGDRLMNVAQTLQTRGAIAAYERLADGGDCRIFNLGPAFGTKFLYFCQPEGQRPQALIHDRNVADWLLQRAGLSLGSATWSARRYREYLRQIHQWAEALSCAPDDVELLMFRSMLGPGNQWDQD